MLTLSGTQANMATLHLSLAELQMNLERRDLRLVLAIGDAGTLLGGARALGIDHSTAFRRLNSLEERLGVRLFVRARDGYAPTAAGEAMIEVAREVDADIAGLERKLAGADLRPSGTVRVTITDTAIDLLTPVFVAFRRSQPAIDLEVAVANQFFALSRREADVAIRPSADVPEELVARRVATVATAPYASPEYLASHTGRDLAAHDWLAPDDSLWHLGSAQWLRRNVPPERIVFRASSLVALQAAARAGLGVAPLPCFLGDVDPALTRLRAPFDEMATSLWVLIHPDLRRAARIRAFVEFVAAALEERRPLIEGRGAPARTARRTRRR